jgi:membrane fusion protein, multidrug efflux system
MKSRLFLLSTFVIIASCSSDKQAELTKLRKQQTAISEKISKLQAELSPADSASEKNTKLVVVKELNPSPFNHYIEVQGRLDGDENVGVSALSGGKIETIYVSVGQAVTKGQVLARIDDAVLQQQLRQMKTNLALLTDIFEKQKNLWDQKVGSEVEFLRAKNGKENMEQQIAVLEDQARSIQLISPINGNVEDIAVKAGQVVAPGIAVIRVVNFSKIKVVADLAEAYSAKINDGDKVLIFFPDINKDINATVTHSSRFINQVTRSFSVEARINNSIPGLKANMVAVLKINDYSNPKAISVPVNLIQKDQYGEFILIAKTGSPLAAKKIMVKTGQIYNGMVEITSGLNPGDKIITIGYQDLEDGDLLRF